MGLFLRTVSLSDYPSGLNADEAALGYNAYSLLLTGKDEHGVSWPVNLISFGDYKPAGYAYLLIPFVKLLGLTEFAVRIPSAIFGVIAIYILYKLTKEIFNENIALTASLLLCISPWHLHYSRGGWEVNVASTFILAGLWQFVIWYKTSSIKNLLFTAFLLLVSMYFYQSARVIAPLLGITLIASYYKQSVANIKQVLIASTLSAVLLIPLGLSIVTSDASSRLSGVGLLADEGPLRRVEQLRGQHQEWNSTISRFFHNRPVIYTIQWLNNYFDHFDGNFLFVNGDEIPRNRVPETGLLYLFDFIFLFLGIVYLIKNPTALSKSIWILLLISPLAASITFQAPHALRAFTLVFALIIIVSCGIYYLLHSLHKHLKPIITLILICSYTWLFSRYLHEYYVHYPQEYPYAWEYGFKELAKYLVTVQDKYKQVWITDKYDQPYIILLFYLQYPPEKFQNAHVLTLRDKFNFSTVRDFDKFHFESTPWEKVRDIHSTLIVASPSDIPSVGVNIVKTINFPNNSPAFQIISN